jgi:hypothetical protein
VWKARVARTFKAQTVGVAGEGVWHKRPVEDVLNFRLDPPDFY